MPSTVRTCTLAAAVIPTPQCSGMVELPSASEERARLNQYLQTHAGAEVDIDALSPSSKHVALGLAVTAGSAVGQLPPSEEQCLASFSTPNGVGLSAGARAWTKHAHRSSSHEQPESVSVSGSWWGNPRGPVISLNESALQIFHKIMRPASWRNLHWLPHEVLVYEVRVEEGYGMRWSHDQSPASSREGWVFRGFVEPMMENGHELRWRH